MKIRVDVKKDNLLEEYARLKNIPLAKVIRNASRDFLQAAHRSTPRGTKGKKTGWLRIAPERLTGTHLPQKDGMVWFGKGMLNSKTRRRLMQLGARVPTLRRGYSKATWIGTMKALGMNRSTPAGMENAQNVSTLRVAGTGRNVEATISNWLGFDNRPGAAGIIIRDGLANAARRIRNDWLRVLKKQGIIERES